MKKTILAAAAVSLIAIATVQTRAQAEHAVVIPAAKVDATPRTGVQTAVFAGGCFWGMEAVFERVKGVRAVTAGYAGGTPATANYATVSTETTRHAEAIKLSYDPRQVSYATLLRVYFSIAHDPTEVNRQGPDSGVSYRSAIFPQSPAQAATARAYIAQLSAAHSFPAPIATRLEQGQFFPAEEYHQRFYDRNPSHPYIVNIDKPKVAAFKAAFPTLATAN